MKFKKIIREDLDLEVTTQPFDLYELYDDMGLDLFSEGNIAALKASGNIDSETGFPLTFNFEDGEFTKLDFSDIYKLDYRFYQTPYIHDLLINTFKKEFPEGLTISLNDYDFDFSVNGLSADFISNCLNEDVWDNFSDYYYYPSFSKCSYYIRDIDKDCLDLLEQIGFPRDIYQQLMDGEVDEEDGNPLSEYYDDLKDIFCSAVSEANAAGSEAACLSDFNSALKDAPYGCRYLERDYEQGHHIVKYLITSEFVENHLVSIWDRFDWNSSYLQTNVIDEFKDTFKDGFDFREPYNGWNEMDNDTLNASLFDRLGDLRYEINKKEDEKNFGEGKLFSLDADGNMIPNKYESLNEEEDLDIEATGVDSLKIPWKDFSMLPIKKVRALIALHGNREEVWSLSLYNSDNGTWCDGNVCGFKDMFGDQYSDYDGYLSFEEAYDKFLNFNLKEHQKLYIQFNPLNWIINCYFVLKREE